MIETIENSTLSEQRFIERSEVKPYYQDDWVTIYHGDAREILPEIEGIDSIITDPVWPNAKAKLIGADRPFELLREVLEVATAERVVLQFGCDSDPRILAGVPWKWPFIRVCWLEYACPTRKGRILYTGDVAYVFGKPIKYGPGRRLMPGRILSTKPDRHKKNLVPHKDWGRAPEEREDEHPCPRRLEHVNWLVGRMADGLIVDPFMGSGTTLKSAKKAAIKSIGIEIEEKYCEIAARRMSQEVLL